MDSVPKMEGYRVKSLDMRGDMGVAEVENVSTGLPELRVFALKDKNKLQNFVVVEIKSDKLNYFGKESTLLQKQIVEKSFLTLQCVKKTATECSETGLRFWFFPDQEIRESSLTFLEIKKNKSNRAIT